ncbi:MAG: OB-fold nucleic acid binding domain-containing protein, partial [Actinomycetota bacterium]|nr:OB-fold nucleic acid binding domain-containing protein [Actinomycetota bacterium]
AWFKLHYPAAFYASIVNSQPMGFWSPETLSEDAKRHGVRVLAPEVNLSGSGCSLEAAPAWGSPPEGKGYMAKMITSAWAGPAMRIGLAEIRGIGDKVAARIADAAPFSSLADLAERASLSASQLETLARAGALSSLGARDAMTPLSRRQAVWVSGPLADRRIPSLPGMALGDEAPELPALSAQESTYLDIATFGISPEAHPFAFMREELERSGVIRIAALPSARDRSQVRVAGVVTHRQRPRTAKGTTFISMEDETGLANVIVVPEVWERYRRTARSADALIVAGRVESHSGVVNVIATSLEAILLPVGSMSRDFR